MGQACTAAAFRQAPPDYTFQKVAAAIRGELQPGDRLPTQRALQEQFGVSKVTILEALRVLEADGLVEVQVGRNGGAVVLDPSHRSLARALGLLLEMDRVDLEEVRELRVTIEVQAARLAAQGAKTDG